jgi:regulator of RNase E activity RraA
VQFEPVAPGAFAAAADYIDEVPPGAVIVIDNAARPCTVWGDILTAVARNRGITGTVINGFCRDIDAIQELDYPLWAVGAFMRTGKNRVRLRATQVPVVLGAPGDTVTIRPGNLVCADGNGVVVVPCELAARTAELATEIAEMEHRVRADALSGIPLREARARHGYNHRRLPTGRPS